MQTALAEEETCDISQVELIEKDIETISYVDEDGNAADLKKTEYGGATPAYYWCNGCQRDWVVNSVQSQKQAWKLVKEHLSA